MRKYDCDTIRDLLFDRYGPRPPVSFTARLEDELFAISDDSFLKDMAFLARLREEARKARCEIDPIPLHGAGLIPFLLDASDIDPLPPHYFCPVCGRIEPLPDGKDGYDLPGKTCCGIPMARNGHAIPFAPLLAQLKREPVPLRFRLPRAFVPTAVQIAREIYYDSGDWHVIPVATLDADPDGATYALIPKSAALPDLDADGLWHVEPRDLFGGRNYRPLQLVYGQKKERLWTASVRTGYMPTVEDLLAEDILTAAAERIQARLRENGRPLLRTNGLSFSKLLVLHGYERSSYPEDNPAFSQPDACYSDVFTCREDVWDTLLLAGGPEQRCGVGLADRLAGRTRRGAFVRKGMDTETVRILRELGVSEHWITQMGRTCYLPPKADVIQTLLDELKCVWWEQKIGTDETAL